MNYGQTAIGEVRVIANYLGRNPWEFESPFVLTNKRRSGIYIYIIYWRFVTHYEPIGLWKFESFFVLSENS